MKRQHHAVRGLLSGLLLGIGVALLLFSYAKVALGTLAFPLVIVIFTVLGLGVGLLGGDARRDAGTEPPQRLSGPAASLATLSAHSRAASASTSSLVWPS